MNHDEPLRTIFSFLFVFPSISRVTKSVYKTVACSVWLLLTINWHTGCLGRVGVNISKGFSPSKSDIGEVSRVI